MATPQDPMDEVRALFGEGEQFHWIELSRSILDLQQSTREKIHVFLKENGLKAPKRYFSGGRLWKEFMWLQGIANATIRKQSTKLADILLEHRLEQFAKYGYDEEYVRSVFSNIDDVNKGDRKYIFLNYLIITDNKILDGLNDTKEMIHHLSTKLHKNISKDFIKILDNNLTIQIELWLNQHTFIDE